MAKIPSRLTSAMRKSIDSPCFTAVKEFFMWRKAQTSWNSTNGNQLCSMLNQQTPLDDTLCVYLHHGVNTIDPSDPVGVFEPGVFSSSSSCASCATRASSIWVHFRFTSLRPFSRSTWHGDTGWAGGVRSCAAEAAQLGFV